MDRDQADGEPGTGAVEAVQEAAEPVAGQRGGDGHRSRPALPGRRPKALLRRLGCHPEPAGGEAPFGGYHLTRSR